MTASPSVLAVFRESEGYFFLTEDGVKFGPYSTPRGAEHALDWWLEDEYWSPDEEGE